MCRWSTKVLTSASGKAGKRRLPTSRPRAASPTRSRQAPRCTNMAALVMSASPRGCARQEKALGFAFDYIVVCTVTGSTHAGMLVGFAKDGRARKVIGIDASFTPAQTKAQVLQIAQKTADLVELGKTIVADDVVLVEDYAYPAYGVPSEETKQAIRLCARLEGMITDPVYEGKSMQGMIDLVKKGYFPEGSKVLYAHLGGAPALNGYAYSFRNG